MFPNCTLSIAPFTAPQCWCPKTNTSLAPATLQANSMLPNKSTFTKFPATLPTKISPKPRSKTSSTGTRLSKQLKTTAFGNCPDANLRTCALWSLSVFVPLVNRLLPSINLCKTWSGRSVACLSAVITSETFCFTSSFGTDVSLWFVSFFEP